MDFVAAAPDMSPWIPGPVSLSLYVLMVVLLVAVILWLAGWLGEKRFTLEKQRVYESGIIPTGPPRQTHPAPFYLVAIFFLIFDVEAAYIFSWAVALQDLGWRGWLQITLFIAILAISLGYLWVKGGLEWGNGMKR